MSKRPKSKHLTYGAAVIRRRIFACLVGCCLLGVLVSATFGAPGATAISSRSPFLDPKDDRDTITARARMRQYEGPRQLRSLNRNGHPICQRLNEEYVKHARLPTNPCTIPLPTAGGDFERPVWTPLEPADHIALIKSWAFWQFWVVRSVGPIDGSPDPQVQELLRQMAERWRKNPNQSASEVLADPPVNITEFSEAGWYLYGARVLAMIANNDFQIEAMMVDINADGKPDRLYRMTRLDFGVWREPIEARPMLQACSRSAASDPRFTSGIYVSEIENPQVNRTLIALGRLGQYDVFFFQHEPYSVSRWDYGIGTISKLRPSRYLPWFAPDSLSLNYSARGVALEPYCDVAFTLN